MNIKMVDLGGQYLAIKQEIDSSIQHVIDNTQFINGNKVKEFANNLAKYHSAHSTVTCANGTDALQIAFMALNLKQQDEVIVPAFTYVATAEVIALLGLTPVLVDVDWDTFNISPQKIREAISPKTKAIVPVHLFGQCANMEEIMLIAKEYNLYVIEDNAQSIGAIYTGKEGGLLWGEHMSGTIGHIGCTSFFPSKNLGAYGDGGAMVTNNPELAKKLNCIANHGQEIKYHHSMVGCNSRLDTIQAAILDVKLKYLNNYISSRQKAAQFYISQLKELEEIELPVTAPYTTHVYHQFTLKVKDGKRDALKEYLAQKGIPSMIYYPLPLQDQKAYESIAKVAGGISAKEGSHMLKNSIELAKCVLSLPMHTELTDEQLDYICKAIKEFYR